MLTETCGFTKLQLGIMSSLMTLAWTLSQWPEGRLIDRFGSKPIMLLFQVSSLPLVAGLMVVSSFAAFAGLYALLGVSAATWLPAQRVILANSTAEREHGEALGRLAAFQGLVGFPAPFIGGLLCDAFGLRAPPPGQHRWHCSDYDDAARAGQGSAGKYTAGAFVDPRSIIRPDRGCCRVS